MLNNLQVSDMLFYREILKYKILRNSLNKPASPKSKSSSLQLRAMIPLKKNVLYAQTHVHVRALLCIMSVFYQLYLSQ